MTWRNRLSLTLVLLLIVLAAVAGMITTKQLNADTPETPTAPSASAPAEGAAAAGEAVEAAQNLVVKGRAPRTGYDRALFGRAWADVDRNGCDTRNDILRRDLIEMEIKDGTGGCRVESGILLDRYSGEHIPFVRGDGTVEIDHVVALSDAWQKGAQQWTTEERTAFANDPLNLIATTRTLNRQKGAGDTATWLPPSKAFRCSYVARQVAVKHRHGIWVTAAEQEAMLRVLAACPDEQLPDD